MESAQKASSEAKETEISEFRLFSEEVAIRAGKLLLKQQTTATVVEQKDLQDVATTADISSEEFIITQIVKRYPKYSIYSEEHGEIDNSSLYRVIIDPLDNTKAFVRGIPLFNVSICLEHDGVPLAGSIYDPSANQIYSAGRGQGASENGNKIMVSNEKDLSKSYIGFYLPTMNRKFVEYDEGWEAVRKISEQCYRVRAEGSSNMALAWLSRGGLEAYLNLTNPPHHHDLVTGLLIAKEAGAVVKEFDNGTFIVANNKYIFDSLTDIINS